MLTGLDERLRHVIGGGGDHDRIEGRCFRPPFVAVADADLHVAVAELGEHLHVVLSALSDPVGLEQLALRLEELDLLLELVADLVQRALDRLA